MNAHSCQGVLYREEIVVYLLIFGSNLAIMSQLPTILCYIIILSCLNNYHWIIQNRLGLLISAHLRAKCVCERFLASSAQSFIFISKLYTSKNLQSYNTQFKQLINVKGISTLTHEQGPNCDTLLTLEDCQRALNAMVLPLSFIKSIGTILAQR